MADFSFLSDTDDEAVDRILAEARDHAILEQVAAINLSGVSDSVLPSHLENRFSRLKTFSSSSSSSATAAHTQQKPQLTSSKTLPPDTNIRIDDINSTNKLTGDGDIGRIKVVANQPNDEKKKTGSNNRQKSRSRRRHVPSSPSSSPASSNQSLENKTPSPTGRKKDPKGRKGFESRRLGSDDDLRSSGSTSISPPRRMSGCLWCSPKKPASKSSNSERSKSKSFSSRRRRRAGVEMDDDEFDWDFTDEVLKDMNSLSFKEQKRILKKAVEEQKKISNEAEKIVKLARQASARMDAGHTHAIGRDFDDELSD